MTIICRALLLAIAIGCVQPVLAQDIIIESGQGCLNSDHYKEIKGEWANGEDPDTQKSHAPGLSAGATCSARKIVPDKATAEARFLPKFKQAGHYFVYVTWPKAANAKQVMYIAKHGSGQGARAAIQNGTGYHNPINGDKWIYLGEYDFKTGDDQYIALLADSTNTTANDPGKPGAMFADAVRFTSKPLTPADGAELFPRDRVELRALPEGGVPAGAVPLLAAAPAKGGPAAPPAAKSSAPPKKVALGAVAAAAKVPPPSDGAAPSLTEALGGDSGMVKWGNDLAAGQKQAVAQPQKRILIYFHSAESILCARYDNELFSNPDIAKLLQEKYIPIKLEIDQNAALASSLGVFRSGVVLIYDSAGNGIKKLEYAQDAASVLKELQF